MSENPRDDSDSVRLHEDDIRKIATVVADLLKPAMTTNPVRGEKESTHGGGGSSRGEDSLEEATDKGTGNLTVVTCTRWTELPARPPS